MYEMLESEKAPARQRKLFFAEVGFFFVAVSVVGLVIFLLALNAVE